MLQVLNRLKIIGSRKCQTAFITNLKAILARLSSSRLKLHINNIFTRIMRHSSLPNYIQSEDFRLKKFRAEHLRIPRRLGTADWVPEHAGKPTFIPFSQWSFRSSLKGGALQHADQEKQCSHCMVSYWLPHCWNEEFEPTWSYESCPQTQPLEHFNRSEQGPSL